MADDVATLKSELVAGLKNYFNNDIAKVRQFGTEIKALGFNLDDADTLLKMKARPEALTSLLGHFDFGTLGSIVSCIEHIKGNGNPDKFFETYVNIFKTK